MCEAVLTPAPRGRGEATLPFTERSRHRATKGSVHVTTREVTQPGCRPTTWFWSSGSKCVDGSLSCPPVSPLPPCGLSITIPVLQMGRQRPLEIGTWPRSGRGGRGLGGAPGSFLRYLRPRGLGGSLLAPTDRNFCAVGSDGPISSLGPTALVAAPYQTPNRPHLSPGREAREAPWALISQGPPCWR